MELLLEVVVFNKTLFGLDQRVRGFQKQRYVVVDFVHEVVVADGEVFDVEGVVVHKKSSSRWIVGWSFGELVRVEWVRVEGVDFFRMDNEMKWEM